MRFDIAFGGMKPLQVAPHDRAHHPYAGDPVDRALASFANAYADQNERDYNALHEAVASGRVAAETGL